jgi:hypothetical protein
MTELEEPSSQKERQMMYQPSMPYHPSLPSVHAAADWRRQRILDEAVAHRLVTQVTGPRPRRSPAPVAASIGTTLVRVGEWLRTFGSECIREPAGS